jgi:hypothetical protein
MGKKNIQIWCNECHEGKNSDEFYPRLVEIGYKEELFYKDDPNKICGKSTENRSNGICKECLIKKYFKYLDDNNGNVKKSIYEICKEYNLPYDEKMIQKYINANKSCSYVLKVYMKDINSLPMYNDEKFHTHKVHLGDENTKASATVYSDKGNALFTINDEEIGKVEEKSDIDFIEEDIKQIKRNIQKTSANNDVNAHGKWLNSFRDALTLREDLKRLEKKQNDNTYDLYFDFGLSDKKNNKYKAIIIFKEEIHHVVGDLDCITKYIKILCKNEKVYIYGDLTTYGTVLADKLFEDGIVVSPTNIIGYNQERFDESQRTRILQYKDYDDKVLNK